MQTSYKILKIKDIYEKDLKEVTCKLPKLFHNSIKSIKKVLQVLESVWKFPLTKNLHHAEIGQSTCNANKLTGCNKMWA